MAQSGDDPPVPSENELSLQVAAAKTRWKERALKESRLMDRLRVEDHGLPMPPTVDEAGDRPLFLASPAWPNPDRLDVPEADLPLPIRQKLTKETASWLILNGDLLESIDDSEVPGLAEKVEKAKEVVRVWREMVDEGERLGDVRAFALELMESGGGGGGGGGAGEESGEGGEGGGEAEGEGPDRKWELEEAEEALVRPEGREYTEKEEVLIRLLPSLRHQDSTVETKKLDELYQKLAQMPGYRKFVEQIGRLSSFAWAAPARAPSLAKEDVVDLELGDDLTKILPTELVRFAIPKLAPAAYADFVEKRMMQRKTIGDEPMARGPVFVAVDLSYSMSTKLHSFEMKSSQLAVLLAAALIKICDIQKRPIYLCGFDDQIRWEKWAKNQNQFVELLSFLLSDVPGGGGTEFDFPIERFCREASSSSRAGADALLVTDGQSVISKETELMLRKVRSSTGMRLFSLILAGSSPQLEHLSDQTIHLREWADLEKLTMQISKRR